MNASGLIGIFSKILLSA